MLLVAIFFDAVKKEGKRHLSLSFSLRKRLYPVYC